MCSSVQQYLVKRKDWFLNYRDVVEQTLNTYTFTMTSLVPDLRCFILAFMCFEMRHPGSCMPRTSTK